MSDQVQLSVYSEAIQNLIRSKRHDQAIALCQHILCSYPKNITTYRQMAEAALEKGDLHSAAELFRRVLSADPEDYVAYAGLAIIFERQALIDEAVWHLERALELNPGHLEIRSELLRLYGERDGRPQTRLRLTPGALARLYLREGLFAQAVQEFRAILVRAPRRLDARVALAETLWHAGQMRDSTQVCQEVLQALPYCLKANLILGKVLQEDRADEAETYLQRAQAIDPTNRVAQEVFGEQSPLRSAEVFVPQYVERSAPTPAAGEPPAADQAPAEGFDEWFAKEPEGFESGGSGESVGLGAPSDSPTEGRATTPSTTPFEQWPPVEEPQAQEPAVREKPAAQEDWTSWPSWVSQIAVPSEPEGSPAAADEAGPEIQPQPPGPQPELPPWLLSDFGLAPSQPTPQPIVPSASSLPPWLIEFQKLHQVDSSAPAPEKAEPSEAGDTVAPSPGTEQESRSSESWPSREPIPPRAAEEASQAAEQTGSMDQAPAEPAVLAPEPVETGPLVPPAVPEIQTAPATEEETKIELPDWLETTRAQAAAASLDTESATQEAPPLQIPDWLKGLEEQIPPEPASRAGEEKAIQEGGEQEEQLLASAPAQEELESEAETALQLSQDESAVQSNLDDESGSSPGIGAWATGTQAEPAEHAPEGESETIVLMEEAADRELYGDETAAPASMTPELSEELGTGEAEPTALEPGSGAPVEASAPAESLRSESIRRRRDPKGYSHLVQARAHCQDNRLGEALKEYDYLVQHSPRLVNAVIKDLEELVRRLEVPLEAHRILGDAYTRADRLADALERYRFVLERVS